MKNRDKVLFLLISVFLFCNGLLHGREGHEEDPHYEWFDAVEVAVCEDGIYIDTNKGMMKLNVVEHDRVNNRYKILCRCLQNRGFDLAESLSIPYASDSE